MTLDLMTYQPSGDKKNSDFFNEYRVKIFERRKSSGLEDLLDRMRGIVVQVEHGDADQQSYSNVLMPQKLI